MTTRQTKQSYFKRLYKKMIGKLLDPETGPETFLKAKMVVFAVLGRQRFITAVFSAVFCASCAS